jgi:hypothetical protein
MKKTSIIAIGALVVAGLFLTSVVLANVGNNEKNGFQVNGKHYNLNIIGAKNVGNVDNGNSMGHTMFVDLYGKTKIIMTQGDEFKVVDRCGVDEKPAETEFMIAPGHYNIYARALGKPGRHVDITAWGEFEELDTTKLLWLGYVKLTREKGKPQSVNINELFYVDVELCIAVDPDTGDCLKKVVYTDFWVFDIPELIEYYWDYDNHGLKLLQVRFYECTLDPTGTADDYCRWWDGTPIDSKKTIEDA